MNMAILEKLISHPSGAFAFEFQGSRISNPCASECGRRVVSPQHYGFEILNTGGNCTAWCRRFADDMLMLVTSADDTTHEIDAAGNCMVGVYVEGQSESLGVYAFDGPGSELRWLDVGLEAPGADPSLAQSYGD